MKVVDIEDEQRDPSAIDDIISAVLHSTKDAILISGRASDIPAICEAMAHLRVPDQVVHSLEPNGVVYAYGAKRVLVTNLMAAKALGELDLGEYKDLSEDELGLLCVLSDDDVSNAKTRSN